MISVGLARKLAAPAIWEDEASARKQSKLRKARALRVSQSGSIPNALQERWTLVSTSTSSWTLRLFPTNLASQFRLLFSSLKLLEGSRVH